MRLGYSCSHEIKEEVVTLFFAYPDPTTNQSRTIS
jgi:hypothetical protein